MKKTLLLGSFAVLGLMANAQLVTQPTDESFAAAGMSSDKTTIDGNVIFAEGEAGVIATAYSDNWGTTNAYGNYKIVKVGDVEVELTSGAVGDQNPTFANYASGVMSAGAVFKIVPAADGWLTIFTKMNPNKQYVVFEGEAGPLSYTLGYSNGETTIHYTLPYDPDTYWIDFADYNVPGHVDDMYDDESPKFTYFVGAGGALGTADVKPNFPWKVVGMAEKFEAQDTGFLTFNVLAGSTYYVSALGSKAAMGTFVLTESVEEPTITYLATDELPEVVFAANGEAGVDAVEVAPVLDENAPVYNVMGQKVNDDYKGIVIQNGKKFIRR